MNFGNDIKARIYRLRQADRDDYQFAEDLYLETSEPLFSKLGSWDERKIVSRFKKLFKPEEASIICVNGEAIGWLQTSESSKSINLIQIHLKAAFRCAGIGSQLIRDLLREAKAKQKPVLLSVVRNNPALTLYQRLGFRIVSEDAEKLRLRWDHEDSDTKA